MKDGILIPFSWLILLSSAKKRFPHFKGRSQWSLRKKVAYRQLLWKFFMLCKALRLSRLLKNFTLCQSIDNIFLQGKMGPTERNNNNILNFFFRQNENFLLSNRKVYPENNQFIVCQCSSKLLLKTLSRHSNLNSADNTNKVF